MFSISILEAKYDSQKSFYGNALVLDNGGLKILKSYGTYVAQIENGVATVNGWYSNTTGRHIKEFLKQNGFKADSKAQILKDYCRYED